MAESMDTSEIVADEDDRKLFVGGLPQVTLVVLSTATSMISSDINPGSRGAIQKDRRLILELSGRQTGGHFGTFSDFWRDR